MKDIFERIFELKRERRVFCLTTLIKSDGSSPRDLGARMIVYTEGNIEYTIGGGALEKLVVEDAVNGFKERKNFTKRYNL
ncbi:MAG: XdhC/CoxI family protein, partial [Caldiserica bacterium]